MRKLGYNIIHLVQLIRHFGAWDGFFIFLKIVITGNTANVSVDAKSFRNSVSIRKANSDIEIFYQVFCELQYDITFYLKYIPLNIIDCGSNVGYSCLYFAEKFPSAKIVAIEPEKNNFRQLTFNTRNYPGISLFNGAIWHANSTVKIKNEAEWSASFEIEENENNNLPDTSLPGKTIDQIATENNFNTIDILKIDIEGAEYNLFMNDPAAWLSITKCLIIELHDNLKPGTSQAFFKEMSKYNWCTYIKGENIICFRDN